MLNKDDILGYLFVLNSPEVWTRLSVEEQQLGIKSIMGCYNRLTESLEKEELINSPCRSIFRAIKRREYLNATLMLPVDDPLLQEETKNLSKILFEFLRGEYVDPSTKCRFITDFQAKMDKILEKK